MNPDKLDPLSPMAAREPPRASSISQQLYAAAGPNARDGYRTLLVRTRGMRRDHAIARDNWFESLALDGKQEILFELEVLLKGMGVFANRRNHPGGTRRGEIPDADLRPALAIAKLGAVRAVALIRKLLVSERVVVLPRYLETASLSLIERPPTPVARATSRQESPEESLLVLRHAFTHTIAVMDALGRLDRVPYRAFYAALGLVQREIARNAFFNPLVALEFRPEFDRLPSQDVFDLVQTLPGDEPHRLVSLAFLSLYRLIHYSTLLRTVAAGRNPSLGYLALAVVRSDARALSSQLAARTGEELSEGYEREIFSVSARNIGARHAALLTEGARLVGIRTTLEGVSAKLRLEIRRTVDRELRPIDPHALSSDVARDLTKAADSLRESFQSTAMFLCHALGARLDARSAFNDPSADPLVAERLRREVWMFAQIVRGFAAKAGAMRAPERNEGWAPSESIRFVREFLVYFRAMGYPILRAHDYPRSATFIATMAALEEADLLDAPRLAAATKECEAFHTYLLELFDLLGKGEALAGRPFDRREAAESLRTYLGEGRA